MKLCEYSATDILQHIIYVFEFRHLTLLPNLCNYFVTKLCNKGTDRSDPYYPDPARRPRATLFHPTGQPTQNL